MNALFASPLGALLAKPWVDRVVLLALRRWYFPLSRLWAAANAAVDDDTRFRIAVGTPLPALWPRVWLRLLLRLNGWARWSSEAARHRWETGLFDASPTAAPDAGVLDPGMLDRRRRRAASRHLGMRILFYPLLWPRRAPAARWEIPNPQALIRELGPRLVRPSELYAVSIDTGAVAVSRAFERRGLREYWLRARTPAACLGKWPGSEMLYARVVEPADQEPTATLISGSGLCLENELSTLRRDSSHLSKLGWRIVEPVSPFHGLRAAPGRYGGEPFFASAPASTVDMIAGQTVESALLIAWCRERFGGKVALAGISMTSFVAQLAASHCHTWPLQARPDGVMLIGHSGSIADVTFGGELTDALGLDRQLAAAGWSREVLAGLSAALDPAATPALPPGRIVSVLGETDGWLPYRDGLDLARRWNLPQANIFRYPLGHLGMPVQLVRDIAPYVRLRQVLDDL